MDTTASNTVLRLGTRGSLLARVQSQMVADELERRHPGLRVELCIFKTSGDQIADRPLHEVGGKGLFTKELEQALLNNRVDMAVHSFKDVPVTMPLVEQEDLIVAAVPPREDPRDVLICLDAQRIQDLPQGAKVGTGSLRRRAQLLALRPDLQIEGIRGNIDTRVRKLRSREFDAVILALAGLKRSGLFDAALMHPIPPADFLPAAGQGALALQCRREDQRTRNLLAAVHHEPSAVAVRMEREVVRRLEGDCFSPIAAFATIANNAIELRVAVGKRGGELPVLHASANGDLAQPDAVVEKVLAILSGQQIRTHLHG
ncbi:MAG: hydroxymethylbilane synthase [Bacillota bacterium]